MTRSNPNQQVPRAKEFRECFVPSPGYKFIIADYSQIELRLAAELVNIPPMAEQIAASFDTESDEYVIEQVKEYYPDLLENG